MSSKGQVTPGPWRREPMRGDTTDYIVTEHPDYQQKPHGNYVGETGLASGHKEQRFEGDCELIVTAVNACFAVCPNNPLAIAEGIVEAFEVLRIFSQCGYDDIETLSAIHNRTRALLARLDERTKG